MAASLKARIWQQASQFPGLQAWLGTTPFRLYDTQLPQLVQFPAVVMFLVSNPRPFVVTGRMVTTPARVQFTVYGTGNDSENASAVVAALLSFFDQAQGNGWGVIGIAGDRDFGIAETDPLTYMRIVDVMIWNDETFGG